MINFDIYQLSLVNAIVAKTVINQEHTVSDSFKKSVNDIAKELGATVDVYDIGIKGSKQRYVKINLYVGELEIEIGPQPEYVAPPSAPEGDGPPGGTPGSAEPARIAA